MAVLKFYKKKYWNRPMPSPSKPFHTSQYNWQVVILHLFELLQHKIHPLERELRSGFTERQRHQAWKDNVNYSVLKDLQTLLELAHSNLRNLSLYSAPGQITCSFGWALPLSCLLHCPVFLPTHVWELFHDGNQCDNTQSPRPSSCFGMWRNSIN